MNDPKPESKHPETPEAPAGDTTETPVLSGYALAWRGVQIDVARRTKARKAAMARQRPRGVD